MTTLLIAIDRLVAGVYEWHLVYGNEVLEKETGDNSITGCLSSAITYVPESEPLVEVKYRGIHMGSFHSEAVREAAPEVAENINCLLYTSDAADE